METEGRGLPPINFSAPPPSSVAVYLPILSPKPGTCIRGEVISQRLVGVWTHFVDGRTEPHWDDKGRCPGCVAKRSKRWKGYVAINWIAGDRNGLLELTAWAVKTCPELAEDPFRDLLGWLVEARRPAGGAQGRVSCSMQPPPLKRPAVFGAGLIDVQSALLKIWSGRRDGRAEIEEVGEHPDAPPF